MKSLFALVSITLSYVLLGANLYAQDAPLSKDKETIDLLQHPVKFDQVLGAASARIGEGVLHQVEVHLIEIPAGGQQPPQRHLAEEVIYIVSGEGYTSMWTRTGEKEQRYDWKAGDYLSPSLNVWHKHVNTSPDKPVRYVSISSAPLTYNLFHSKEFLTSSDFVFEDRWQQGITQQPIYTPEGGFEGPEVVRMRVGHVLPNLPGREMARRAEDVLGITILPEGDMAGNHIMEMEVRELQGANKEVHVGYSGHRHPWETVYVMLEGKGFSILQRPGQHARRVNWQAGDLIIVEANEFHDHRTGSDSTGWSNLQVKPSGYFHGVGNVGGTDQTPIPEEFR